MQAKQSKKFTHCFQSAGRLLAVSKKAGLHHTIGCLDPLPPPVFQLFLLSHMVQAGIPFGHVGSAVPSQLHVHPSLLIGRVEWEAEKALIHCKHWSAKTTLSSTLTNTFIIANLTHGTIPASIKKSGFTPSWPSTVTLDYPGLTHCIAAWAVGYDRLYPRDGKDQWLVLKGRTGC